MGLFDYVEMHDDRAVCAAGHDCSSGDWQTKDLDCGMSRWRISGGVLSLLEKGGYGDMPALPFVGRIHVYSSCPLCPVVIQADTFNWCPMCVSYTLTIVDDVVRDFVADCLETPAMVLAEKWMLGAKLFTSHEEAEAFREAGWRNAIAKEKSEARNDSL